MKARYTVTVKDNLTGEVVSVNEANAMISALASGDEATPILLQGEFEEMGAAMNCVQELCERVFRADA